MAQDERDVTYMPGQTRRGYISQLEWRRGHNIFQDGGNEYRAPRAGDEAAAHVEVGPQTRRGKNRLIKEQEVTVHQHLIILYSHHFLVAPNT